jgi:CPA2 family monovalent cation:H+ antiporter-2
MHVPTLVAALAIVVVATAIFGYIAQRIGLVAIVGYIVAGIVIGPYALGFIADDFELVEAMGEIGVIFLMFFIGLELGGDLLKKLGALLFGGGAIQVTLTIALVAAIAAIFGVDVKTGIYTGCLVALSSTAVVLKLLSARNETASPSGEVSVAFLIFQDIAVVILVLLVPMLGDAGGSLGAIVLALVKALLLIVVVLVVSKWVIPPILDAVWKNSDEEAFLLIVLALAAGIAYGVTLVGLTASLGAFVAGLVISGGEHRERATGIILPFQALFAAIFFASIGMRLDPGALLETWPLVLLFSVVVVIIKFIGVGTAAAVFKRPLPVVVSSGLVLAQIGEFSFILENIGRQSGLSPLALDETGSQVFIAVTVLLIALTPLLFKFGNVMQKRLEGQQTAKSVS